MREHVKWVIKKKSALNELLSDDEVQAFLLKLHVEIKEHGYSHEEATSLLQECLIEVIREENGGTKFSSD